MSHDVLELARRILDAAKNREQSAGMTYTLYDQDGNAKPDGDFAPGDYWEVRYAGTLMMRTYMSLDEI